MIVKYIEYTYKFKEEPFIEQIQEGVYLFIRIQPTSSFTKDKTQILSEPYEVQISFSGNLSPINKIIVNKISLYDLESKQNIKKQISGVYFSDRKQYLTPSELEMFCNNGIFSLENTSNLDHINIDFTNVDIKYLKTKKIKIELGLTIEMLDGSTNYFDRIYMCTRKRSVRYIFPTV
ncbi:hypothetical protein AGMMS50293_28530 [Spirochaetia bacterium]|nr:hypothetical protein AGMMS50293_28530 [Spirochaetia bacterium]